MKTFFSLFFFIVAATTATAQTTYTPTEYKVRVYTIEISTDGSTWVTILDNGSSGNVEDLAGSLSNFGDGTAAAGTYKYVRFTVHQDLVWSYPNPPISLSDQTFTVSDGPPGPESDQMTVYFATPAEGGKPNGGEGGGDGTAAEPFLLAQSFTINASGTNNLTMISGVSDTLENNGGWDLQPPKFFFVNDTGNASALSGTYNVVAYGQQKEFTQVSPGVFSLAGWRYEASYGTLTFDGSGTWSASLTFNDYNLQTESGAITVEAVTGRYGVSTNTFWMTVDGEHGTLEGAFGNDVITAAMLDNAEGGLMFFGTLEATSASASTFDGSDYYFTTMGANYSDGSPDQLQFGSGYGIGTATTGAISGTSTSNSVTIDDPLGTPSSTGPAVSGPSAFSDTLTIGSTGAFVNTSTDMRGGILQNGVAACIAENFNGTYAAAWKFGFLVEKAADGTHAAADLLGQVYAGSFSGDHYQSGDNESHYFAGTFVMTFPASESDPASILVKESLESGIQESTMSVTWSVNNDGTVDFQDQSDPGAPEDPITGALSSDLNYLILFAKAESGSPLAPTEQRFVGLGIKQ